MTSSVNVIVTSKSAGVAKQSRERRRLASPSGHAVARHRDKGAGVLDRGIGERVNRGVGGISATDNRNHSRGTSPTPPSTPTASQHFPMPPPYRRFVGALAGGPASRARSFRCDTSSAIAHSGHDLVDDFGVEAEPPRSKLRMPSIGGRGASPCGQVFAKPPRRARHPGSPRVRAPRRTRAASPWDWPRSCPRAKVPCRAAPRPSPSWDSAHRPGPRGQTSAPAIEPNIASTRSLRQSPSRFSVGITTLQSHCSVIRPA